MVAIAAFVLLTSAERDEQGVITEGGDVRAASLRVGDCVNGLNDATVVSSLPAVPCGQVHEGEVFAVFDLPAGDYPGVEEVDRLVDEGCNARLETYSTRAVEDPDIGLYYVFPQELNWIAGDRSVSCLVLSLSDDGLTGSVRGA